MYEMRFLLKSGRHYGLKTMLAAMLSVSSIAPAMAEAPAAAVVVKAENPVKVNLSVHKLEMKQGKEHFVSAESALPGDVLEYRANYKNVSNKPVDAVFASLPIPDGAEYIVASAFPKNIVARARGEKEFAITPLQQEIVGVDGKKTKAALPLAAYGAIGWQLGTIKPAASTDIRVRVRIPGASANDAVPPVKTVATKS